MGEQEDSKPQAGHKEATEHVAGAYQLLKALQDKIGEHPEIGLGGQQIGECTGHSRNSDWRNALKNRSSLKNTDWCW